jgi:hypothetical protein
MKSSAISIHSGDEQRHQKNAPDHRSEEGQSKERSTDRVGAFAHRDVARS